VVIPAPCANQPTNSDLAGKNSFFVCSIQKFRRSKASQPSISELPQQNLELQLALPKTPSLLHSCCEAERENNAKPKQKPTCAEEGKFFLVHAGDQ